MKLRSLYSLCICCVFSLFLSTCSRKGQTYVWKSEGDRFTFAEDLLPDPPKKTAVCFSGGGTRAMTCATGQMKGLEILKLWDEIGYISSVSGGTWASSIFTYYNSGADNDAQLLGTTHKPGDLTMVGLNDMDPAFLASGATCNLTDNILERALEDEFSGGLLQNSDRIWIDAVGSCYLEAFGLYDPKHPKYFTLNRETRDDIISRNPKLKLDSTDFYLVHSEKGDIKRPFLVMNSCLLAPEAYLPIDTPEPLAVFNYTPLYIGSAHALDVSYHSKLRGKRNQDVGGGFIQPFAFGSEAPKSFQDCGDQLSCAKIKESKRRFELVDAAGTSSAAFAATVASSIMLQLPTKVLFNFTMDKAIPEEKYWPIPQGKNNKTEAVNFRFADGGSLDNYGIITMLQRKVDRMVVFINTYIPIDVGFVPNQGFAPCPSAVDSDFPPLFGYVNGNQTMNKVFPTEDFGPVFDSLRATKVRGETVMAFYQGKTVRNDWWGIPAGQAFEILFVYNDQVSKWEDQLLPQVKDEINLCNSGQIRNFPHYPTIFPNGAPNLTQLTNAEVNLLYELQAWNVYSNPDAFKFLKGGK